MAFKSDKTITLRFGLLRFILAFGLMGFANGAVLLFLVLRLMGGETLDYRSVLSAAFIWYIAGVAWGWFMWHFNRRIQANRERNAGLVEQ